MLTVNPETFEVIEEAFFLAENMDDGMTVIQKCPSAVSAAFDIQRLISCLAESEIQILDNCLNLWRIISMDDDEVVSQDADFTDIDDLDVFAEFFIDALTARSKNSFIVFLLPMVGSIVNPVIILISVFRNRINDTVAVDDMIDSHHENLNQGCIQVAFSHLRTF